jgi:hypothetical protein
MMQVSNLAIIIIFSHQKITDMELKGHGFTIRCWKKGDEKSLQKHADNPNISDFLMDRFPAPYTLASAIFWVNGLLEQDPLVNFAIAVDDEVVGGMGSNCVRMFTGKQR